MSKAFDEASLVSEEETLAITPEAASELKEKTSAQEMAKELKSVEPLPFEKDRPPREWTQDERYEWIMSYRPILRKAAKPFHGLTKITYMDSDDLEQIVMEVTLRCFDSYNEQQKTKFSTYVYRAITNEFVSLFRAANAGKRKGDIFTGSLNDIQPSYDDAKSDTPALEPNRDFSMTDTLRVYVNDVETYACNTLLLEEIDRLLHCYFKEPDCSIFLRVISGESQLDVAASLHVPQATVSTVVRRVRTRLLTYMKYSKRLTW